MTTDFTITDEGLADEIKRTAAELERLIELGAKRGMETRLRLIPAQIMGSQVGATVIECAVLKAI